MHINWLELRAKRLSIQELTSQGDTVYMCPDNMIACAHIRKQFRTCSKPVHTECTILARSHLEEPNNIAPTLDYFLEVKMSAPSGRGVSS